MRKNFMPVLIVIGLIIVVAAAGIISMVIGRYTPTREREDLARYFELEEGQAALIVNDERSDSKGLVQNGEIYMSYEDVTALLDTHFYLDQANGQMLLTLPDGIQSIAPGDTVYTGDSGAPALIRSGEGTYYLALSFIQKYADMDCAIFEEPARAVIRTRWSGVELVKAAEDTAVRVKGGIKSPILEDVEQGEELVFLEALENWTKVATAGGCIGYVENSALSDEKTELAHAVNGAGQFPSLLRDHKINLAWHQVTSQAGNSSFPEIIANASGLNVISPTWFSIADNNGALVSYASRDYVEQAHAMGLEVWGLIDNFSTEISTQTVLSDSAKRAYIIEQLLSAARETGMDGINVDFEQLSRESIPHFLQFLRELTLRAHEQNLVISVDNPMPQAYNLYYKRSTQSKIVDYVILMGYDEHYSGGEEAGSVASLPFVEAGIQLGLQEVPAEKLINAIPFYTRVWTETYGEALPSSEVLGMDGTDRYIQEHQMSKEWDESVGQYVAITEDDTARYTIWVEDEKSLEEKMKLVQSYGLAGVAEWKLGFERASVWEIISRYLQ